jgi:hypothetical protein
MGVEELLSASGRGVVHVKPRRDQPEVRSDDAWQLVSSVTSDGQSAASGRTVRAEGRENHMTARTQRPPQRCHVSIPISCLDHEVKHRTVVPELKMASEVVEPDIRLDPRDRLCGRAKLGARTLNRCFGKVRHRHVGVAGCNEITGQLRASTADIEDRGIQTKRRFLDQRQGEFWHSLIPAQLLGLSLQVHALPVRPRIRHGPIVAPPCGARQSPRRRSRTHSRTMKRSEQRRPRPTETHAPAKQGRDLDAPLSSCSPPAEPPSTPAPSAGPVRARRS